MIYFRENYLNDQMIKKRIGNLDFYFFKNLSKHKEIFHFVSTKSAGNLALHTNNDSVKVLKNRKNLAKTLKISLDNFVFMNQVHGKNIKEILEKDRGSGVKTYENSVKQTDAAITSFSNICLTVLVADCVPILFFDPFKKVISAVHAGRKGTELKIAKETVEFLKNKYYCQPKNLIVGLGPSIGCCCYKDSTLELEYSTPGVDLWEENKKQLIESEVIDSNIEVAEICTYCHGDEFFSARREKNQAGRFAVGLMIKP